MRTAVLVAVVQAPRDSRRLDALRVSRPLAERVAVVTDGIIRHRCVVEDYAARQRWADVM